MLPKCTFTIARSIDLRNSPGLKRVLIGVLALALLPICGLCFAPWILRVGAPGRHTDAIVLLGGDDGSRALHAARLFHQGYAAVIIVTGDWEFRPQELMGLGVPERAIIVEGSARSTAENAQFTRQVMKQHGWTSALIVTSWWHTRRAQWCFEKFGGDMQWSMQPTWQSPEIAATWGSPVPSILKEYPKFLWYLIRYGI